MPNRRPLHFITREKELHLLQKLETIIDCREFDPSDTAVMMVSPDYSATVAMHLAHAWSKRGEIIPIIPVDVPYPDETNEVCKKKLDHTMSWFKIKPRKLVLVEAGIIRGSNWNWILNSLYSYGYTRDNIVLVALCENVHSKVKSDYVAEYYNDDDEDLTFYYEKYNKHWPVK